MGKEGGRGAGHHHARWRERAADLQADRRREHLAAQGELKSCSIASDQT